MFAEITPLILTYNESPNAARTLNALRWAREIVVVDSFSTDETTETVRSYSQVRLVQRTFDNHTDQWNYGLDQVATEWVLSLDADYVLTDEFIQELKAFESYDPEVCAWYAKFKYCIAGRVLRSSLYPPRAVLFRKSRCRYREDGHTQKLNIEGSVGMLKSFILHDDRKPLQRWLREQERYAALEAAKLLAAETRSLRFSDRLRRLCFPAPFLVFFYALLAKGLILDGWPGWFYVLQRTYAEILIALHLLEAKYMRRHD